MSEAGWFSTSLSKHSLWPFHNNCSLKISFFFFLSFFLNQLLYSRGWKKMQLKILPYSTEKLVDHKTPLAVKRLQHSWYFQNQLANQNQISQIECKVMLGTAVGNEDDMLQTAVWKWSRYFASPKATTVKFRTLWYSLTPINLVKATRLLNLAL